MTSSRHSKVDYLRVSVTDRCNFQCKYCVPPWGRHFLPQSEILTYEEIAEIVRCFKEIGLNSVRLTGGEPLIRKKLENLVLTLNEMGLEDISLTTNGFFLEEKARVLFDSGLRRVNISIDSLKEEKFSYLTGVDALKKVIRGLEKALEVGFSPVKVNVVFIKGFNDDEIEDFIKFSEAFGVEVRFIELMPVGGKFFSSRHFLSVDKIKELVESKYGKLIPAKTFKKGPSKSYRVPGTNAIIGFIPSVSRHFCATCNRLRLTSDGKLRFCLMRDEEIDLKSLLRSGDYSREKLLEILKNAVKIKKNFTGISALKGSGCERAMFTIGG